MVELRRTVRFCVNPGEQSADSWLPGNGFGGSPPMRGLGRYYELDLSCRGEPNPATGYLINIKDLDTLARTELIPRIGGACARAPDTDPGALMPGLYEAARRAAAAPLHALRWRLTPTYSLEMTADAPGKVILRQRFDLAAAHRLHAPGLSDEENRRVFGRCNNPSGHGHNYVIEPAVAVPVQSGAVPRFTLEDLERLTRATLIEPFDHTHLNVDTAEFAQGAGEVPSVENIARVFHGLLGRAVREASHGGAELRSITVWETDRTSCTYPG